MNRRLLFCVALLALGFSLSLAVLHRKEHEQGHDAASPHTAETMPGKVSRRAAGERSLVEALARKGGNRLPRDGEYPADSELMRYVHYQRMIVGGSIPGDELAGFLETFFNKLPKDHAAQILRLIVESNKYSFDEKWAVFDRFHQDLLDRYDTDFNIGADFMEYYAKADMDQARELLDRMYAKGMFNLSPGVRAFYNHRCSSLPKYLEVVTSDIRSEHPFLAPRPKNPEDEVKIPGFIPAKHSPAERIDYENCLIATDLADAADEALIQSGIASPEEVIEAVESAQFEEDLKNKLLVRLEKLKRDMEQTDPSEATAP
jgi:hypothetical protein